MKLVSFLLVATASAASLKAPQLARPLAPAAEKSLTLRGGGIADLDTASLLSAVRA